MTAKVEDATTPVEANQALTAASDAITIPRLISYQGRLTDTLGVPVPDGNYQLTFRLYNQETGGNPFWSETQTVAVRNGLFSVLLGAVTPIPSVPDAGVLYLGLQVGAGSELTPRLRIASAPYAYLAGRSGDADAVQGKDTTYFAPATHTHSYVDSAGGAQRVGGYNITALDTRYVNEDQADAITSAMIQDSTIATADIADNAVNSAKVADGAIATADIANGAVNSAKVADGAIVRADVAADFKAPYADTADYARLAVAVDSARVAANSHRLQGKDTTYFARATHTHSYVDSAGGAQRVGGYNITGLDARYVNEDQANAITSAMIQDGTIATEDIADNAVNSAKVADGAIATADIADNAVTSAKIADGTIATADLSQMGATNGQVLKWTGSQWAPRNDSVGYGDNAWVRRTPDSVLFTIRRLGIARGGANNMLYGNYRHTHTNLGVACTTGTSGQNYGYCTIGGGYGNTASGVYATVGGGDYNTASGIRATVGGGAQNTASNWAATVAGGFSNTASGEDATVAGGYGNTASGVYATVGGGIQNTASGWYATVGGGYADTATGAYASALSGYSNLAGDGVIDTAATIAGGYNNSATAKYSFVGGGYENTASGEDATVGGGYGDTASGWAATVGGGAYNAASGSKATVGGGGHNTASSDAATVGGGAYNAASGWYATVGGGYENTASGNYATVAGGEYNTASGNWATVAGGYADTSAGWYSFTAGDHSVVSSSYSNSAAFNGQTATASGQTRVGALSKASGSFTIDHPLDPYGKILNHYFIEGPEMVNLYRGSVVLDASGRAEVHLPDYFSALNRNPHIQLTGVGTNEVVYVAEDIVGNRFVIGGKPGAKVYWQVTGERQDVSAEVTRRMMPVEQKKTGELAGRMLDDEFLSGCMEQLEREGKSQGIDFRTAAGRQRYLDMKRHMEEMEQKGRQK